MNYKQKYFLIASAALALFFGFLIPTPRLGFSSRPSLAQTQNKFERAQAACVLIRNLDGSSGSAFIISCHGTLVAWTASHVVEKVNETRVTQVIRNEGFKAGEIYFPAKVIARDADSDLALLWLPHVSAEYFRPVHFSSAALPRVGAPVFHAGNFLGAAFDRSVSAGIVSQVGVYAEHMPWKIVDQANITVIYGSSGGPLFDDAGNVLGVIVGLHPRIPGVAFFVPAREVVSFGKLHSVSWAVLGDAAPSEFVLQSLSKSAEVTPESE